MIGRVLFFCLVLLPYIVLAVPLQFVFVRLKLPFWNVLPRLFHRAACTFLGLRVTLVGKPVAGRPTLLLSNHVSWTDILAIGSVADVTFVAKSEIRRWPVVGFMAGLQRTIYVDRNRRTDARRTSVEMATRLGSGGAVLLFAEGQSDIGTHVLPFRSALVGAAQAAMAEAGAREVSVQPVTIAYTRLQGLPVSRNERAQIGWSKSRTLGQNIVSILSGSTRDVTVAFGAPIALGAEANRKMVTRRAEETVRETLVALNRGRALPAPAPA